MTRSRIQKAKMHWEQVGCVAQFCTIFTIQKKREKRLWRSVTYSNHLASACNFTKSNTPKWVFFTFWNCANGTESRNASQVSSRTLHFQFPWFLLYFGIAYYKKFSKIRNQFTVRSRHRSILQQHENATNEWMIT